MTGLQRLRGRPFRRRKDLPLPPRYRLIYVLDRYPELSQTFVHDEILEMRRQGVDVVVVALHEGSELVDADPADFVLNGASPLGAIAALLRLVTLHPVRLARFVRTAVRLEFPYTKVALLELPRCARRLSYTRPANRVHAHFAWGASAMALYLAALLDVPMSMTVHARDLFVKPQALDMKVCSANPVVTVCEYNRTWLQQRGYPAAEIEVVPCGVSIPGNQSKASEPVAVAIGRFVRKKGFDLLVQAVAIAAVHVPDLKVHLVGDGPERPAIEQLIVDLGLETVVTLWGALPHAEALRVLDRARVFALPCRIDEDGDSDAMPVVIREAMARAVPVISTPIAGIPETVVADVGWLTPSEDVAALAQTLVEALNNPEVSAVKGRAARDRVERLFTVSTSVESLRSAFARHDPTHASARQA